MSLIIKGMQLPRKSERRECSIAVVQNRPVSIAFSRTKTNPLECFECAEIPTPHGRLIDADANVGSYVETWTCNCSEFGAQRVMAVDDLKYLPTIIEAEVSE